MDFKFCTECGTKVPKHYRVCSNCGKQFANVQDSYEQRQGADASGGTTSPNLHEIKEPIVNNERSKKQASRSKKLTLTIGSILAALLLGGYYLGSTLTSKQKVIQKFDEALKEKDASMLVGIVDTTDPNIKISAENVFPFISYIEENSQNPTFSALEKAGFVNIHPSGKKWLLFDNYKINIKSFYPVISTNYDGTEIYINKKRVGKINRGEGKTFGPYLIGEYKLKALYKGKYATLDKEEVIDPKSINSKEIEVKFTLPENNLSIYSDEDDAFLFVNGKNTNQRIGEIDQFGPVVFDGSITIHAETEINGNVIKSNETTLVDEDFTNVGLIFDYQEDDPAENEVVTAGDVRESSEVVTTEEDLSSLNVEDEVKVIRAEYNSINKVLKNYNVNKLGASFTQYINDNGIIKKIVKKDNGVTTEYYFWDDGSLFFIFTTTAKPLENRYYFKNNQMIRWIDSDKRTIDINSGKVNQEYREWENFWVNQILSSID
ncbi:zinc ribbon domain-containing protein [Neobacillus sp. SuZ13]|uniref:zinc ribbon domain-containing protein n=1 Tax=Neobacillus sp. SuZ13 TaxID=3047875 RepID=UPI0024BFA3F7|nr:zinc ribbon domain-containing protein [Neobacillus sp. SuZ13]WHY64765.1 hypothetical protein QNH17_16750 [Neobacillus sp. SuZ13]